MENVIEKKIEIKRKSVVREYAEAAVIALILALFVRTFIIQAFKIPSGSMKNTLLIGDHILVNKFIYGIPIPFSDIKLFSRAPQRGDIIVFKYPKDESRDFIKRVVATPGDKVEIKNQRVYINDHLLEEPYAVHKKPPLPPPYSYPRDSYGPVEIPDNKLFMMGDNRENSQDSRFWGLLDINKVKGKAFIIYWSWDKENYTVRWGRISDLLK